MSKRVADLYDEYVKPGCARDLKRIAMWTGVMIAIALILNWLWR